MLHGDAKKSRFFGATFPLRSTTLYGMLTQSFRVRGICSMRLFFCGCITSILLLTACASGRSNPGVPTVAAFPNPTLPPTAPPATATATPTTATATTQPTISRTVQPTETAVRVIAYVFPVADAAVTYGKVHHDYPATDIFCDIGSAFVAVTDGVVDAIVREDLWDPASDVPADRSGLAVAIIGSDGVRYYGSHLSAIADGLTVGQTVRRGALLGKTGKSGNARFTPAHLHFGISQPTTPDDWEARRGQISPYPYLQAWQNGEVLTPTFEP